MIIYIIRHADPDYLNDTITEFGWKQANALAKWLKEERIDKIYTSPMGRAIDTASPTCKVKGMKSEILPWAAEHDDYMTSHLLKHGDKCSYCFSLEKGIYDYKDFQDSKRMQTVEKMLKSADDFLALHGYVREGAFYKVTKENDERIAIFCHGGFGSTWISHLIGLPAGLSFGTISLSTSSVTEIYFPVAENNYIRPHLNRLGEIHHMRRAGLKNNESV